MPPSPCAKPLLTPPGPGARRSGEGYKVAPSPLLWMSVRRLRLRRSKHPLEVVLGQSLAADCDDQLGDAGDERERRDQGERDERTVPWLGEHHDPEQDRDEPAEDQQSRVASVDGQPERPDDGEDSER